MANTNLTVKVSNENSVVVIVINEAALSVTVSDISLRGRPGVVWRGAFVSSTDYYAGDIVSYSGSSYIASSYTTASETTPNNSATFSIMAKAGDTGVGYTHPVEHPISLITGLQDALDGKVDEAP